MALTLRPGFRTSRRDAATLQVGLDHRVLLPDSPATRDVLDRLASGEPVEGLPGAEDVLTALRDRDLLVDDSLATASRSAAATHGADAGGRRERRRQVSVAVHTVGDWGADVLALLGGAGLGPVGGPDPAADVALLVCVGEPDRERLDPLMLAGQPHLLVVAAEGAARVGPFVSPGRTACLRCVDAHLDERDGRRGIVLQQVRECGVAVEPPTAYAAASLAVRDLVAWADGDRPWTWSATAALGADPAPVWAEWRRHPHCGCCWGDLLDAV